MRCWSCRSSTFSSRTANRSTRARTSWRRSTASRGLAGPARLHDHAVVGELAGVIHHTNRDRDLSGVREDLGGGRILAGVALERAVAVHVPPVLLDIA